MGIVITFCTLLKGDHGITEYSQNLPQTQSRNLKKADWGMFRQIAEIKFENKSNDMEYDEFATNLQEIVNLTIPEKNKNIKINKPSCPWWDEDCNNQIKERKKNLKRFQEQPDIGKLPHCEK